jgi:hypothetical protein
MPRHRFTHDPSYPGREIFHALLRFGLGIMVLLGVFTAVLAWPVRTLGVYLLLLVCAGIPAACETWDFHPIHGLRGLLHHSDADDPDDHPDDKLDDEPDEEH